MAKRKKYKKLGDYQDKDISEIDGKRRRDKRKESINKNKLKKKRFILIGLLIVLTIILLFIDFLLPRIVLEKQLDDVSPSIMCEEGLYEKTDVLMIVPIFESVSVAQNETWCEEILAMNKTLGMHGVYHTYNEFEEVRDEDYIRLGMEEFKKCFGFYPEIFEAPQLALSKENEEMLRELGFEVRKYGYSFFHKVYHCSDTGAYSNRVIDWF